MYWFFLHSIFLLWLFIKKNSDCSSGGTMEDAEEKKEVSAKPETPKKKQKNLQSWRSSA